MSDVPLNKANFKKMPSTHIYRCIKSSWGVYVKLRAEVVALGQVTTKLIPAIEHIALTIEPPVTVDGWDIGVRLGDDEIECLCRGIRIVREQLKPFALPDKPLVIRVVEVTFSICDYQPEGLTCAMIGWLGENFGFRAPQIPVDYDSKQRRYLFSFPAD